MVVGYVEPHAGRQPMMALVDRLEQISPSTVQHRGISLREFDLDAVLARHPRSCWWTNWPTRTPRVVGIEALPGRRGAAARRHQRVHHRERPAPRRLNDKIAAITHVSVAERIPDRIFDRCIGRARRYRARRSDRALRQEDILSRSRPHGVGNFFSRKNLAALREIALRRMADRLTRKAECTEAGARGGRRGRAGVRNAQYGQRESSRIRAAANMAESHHGALTAVVVESSQSKSSIPTSADDCAPTSIWPKSCAHVVTLFGDDIAQQLAQYAVTAGATHIVVGNATGGLSVRSRCARAW